MNKILIINGHPAKNSFCDAISKTYAETAAGKGKEVAVLNLYDLDFNLNFTGSYNREMHTGDEKDLLQAREKIIWAQHLVIVHPVWWGSVPALLKGFLDRVLIPGFAFKYKKNSPFWDKLLSGRTATLIYTADTPVWYYNLVYRAPSVNMMRDRVLGFCGIKTRSILGFGSLRFSNDGQRKKWLHKVEKLASKEAS